MEGIWLGNARSMAASNNGTNAAATRHELMVICNELRSQSGVFQETR